MREKMKSWLHVKSNQNKVIKWFAFFMFFMLVCTIISRGIYTMRMPQVSVGNMESKSIDHTVNADGIISAGKETAVLTLPGIHISEVCVRNGQQVQVGTVLFRLDMDELKKLEEQAKTIQKIAETKLNDANTNLKTANELEQKNKNRALQDINDLSAEQNKEIERAENEVNIATRELESFPSLADYVRQQALQNHADDNADGSDKEDADIAADQEVLKDQLIEKEWQGKKEELEKTLQTRKNALQDVKDTMNGELTEANRKLEDTKDITVDHSTILELKNEVDLANQNVSDLQSLIDKNGEVCSEISGNITRINCEIGEKTGDSAAMVIADGSNGWVYTAVIDQEQKKHVSIGDRMNLSFEEGKKKMDDVEITSIQKVDGDNYEISAFVTGDLVLGESGSFTLTQTSERYPACVPLSALYADNNKNYILIIRENATILGTELSVEKMDVTVIDKNTQNAAIECIGTGTDDKIVFSADRAVSPGDKVRLPEAE